MAAKHHKARYWIEKGVFDGLSAFRELEKRIDAIEEEIDRGDIFEIFVEALLETDPIIQCVGHWVVGHVPLSIREELNLPSGTMGIDGVYRDKAGGLTPYQVKYRRADNLTFAEVAPFLGVTERSQNRVIFTSAARIAKEAKQRDGVRLFLADKFHALEPNQFCAMEAWLNDKPLPVTRATPDPAYQTQALADINATLKTSDRATIVMACGTGKTLVSLWAVEQAKPKTVLVLVPTLLLLKQTLKVWSEHTNLDGGFRYLCVCSDKTVGLRNDEAEIDASEAGFRVDTDPIEVKRFLEQDCADVKVVFTTYHSSPVVGEAIGGLPPFDVAIFDEAHKTTGRVGSSFTFALSNENIPITKRLFFTATPRHYNPRKRDKEGDLVVASMDDQATYGPRAHTLSFAAAAKLGVICPYKVIITLIDKKMVDDFVLRHGITLVEADLINSRWVANLIALERAIEVSGSKKAITFHSRITSAKEFAGEDARGISRYLPEFDVRHVNGKQSVSDRQSIINAFREAPAGVLTNARCLTEGIDVPAIDMVAFIDPKRSRVDIAQAVGRAMRKPRADINSTKTIGYVVVPLFAGGSDEQSLEDAIHTEAFDEVADVLNALQEHDEDLVDIINEMRRNKGEGRSIDQLRFREKIQVIGPEVDLQTLTDSISLEVGDRLGNKWSEWYGCLLQFKEREGHCRVLGDYKTGGGFRLGGWVSKQRSNRDKMPAERIALLDEIGFTWDALDDAWNEGYEHLKAFKEREGNCRVSHDYKTESGYRLGQWATRQRTKPITAERVVILNDLDFIWDPTVDAWNEGYKHLKEFKQREGHCRVLGGYKTESGFGLGGWVSVQRGNRHDANTPERIALLDEIGFTWDVLDDTWNEGYEHLKAFKEREGNCRIPYSYKTEGEFRLGQWVSVQRRGRDAIPDERIVLLDKLGFTWNALTDKWTEGYEHLKEFTEREGNCRVPQNYKTESGFRLGTWIGGQRGKRNSPERVALLDELGFIWDAIADAWDEGIEHLKEFKKREGHCRVLRPYKTEGGFELGRWVGDKRNREDKLGPEQIAILNDLGFIWDPHEDAWNLAYGHLKEFKHREGHCRFTTTYKTKSGFKLGGWANNQRSNREKMPVERIALLDDLGFIWDPSAEVWNEGRKHLNAFKEGEGHCAVPMSYTTKTGFKLGNWVSNWRSKRDKIPAERIAFLDELGFVWDPRADAWNEACEHLKEFKEREGHCRVPSRYRTESGFELGVWVYNRRSKRDRLPIEHVAQLDELGFVWTD